MRKSGVYGKSEGWGVDLGGGWAVRKQHMPKSKNGGFCASGSEKVGDDSLEDAARGAAKSRIPS